MWTHRHAACFHRPIWLSAALPVSENLLCPLFPRKKAFPLTVFIFAVCTLIGLLFQKLNFTDTNIVTIYILGVLLTSIVTDGYLCSVAGSFLSVFLFCFFLTEPGMSFKTYAVGYPVTFFIMLISSVLTGALAAKLKTHAKLSAQLAFRTQIARRNDTNGIVNFNRRIKPEPRSQRQARRFRSMDERCVSGRAGCFMRRR